MAIRCHMSSSGVMAANIMKLTEDSGESAVDA